jgi:transposase
VLARAGESRISHLRHAATPLLSHRTDIVAWWNPGVNNAFMEGIAKNLNSVFRRTRGLRDDCYWVVRFLGLNSSRQELSG